LTQRSLDASIAALQNLPQVPKQPSVEKPHVPSLYLHVPLIDFACRLIPSPAFGEFNVSNESTVSAALMAFYDYLDAEYALKALASRVAKPAQRNDFKQKHAEALDALRRLKSALENGELPEEDKTIVEIEHRIQVLEHAMKALEDIDCFHLQCDSFSLKVLISANKQANSIFESTWDTALEQLFIHYFIVNSLYRADPLFYKEELCTYIQRSLQHIEHRTAHRAWNSITRSALKASVVYFNDTMESSSFR
jgi:DNA repair ATPase RecN